MSLIMRACSVFCHAALPAVGWVLWMNELVPVPPPALVCSEKKRSAWPPVYHSPKRGRHETSSELS